MTEQLRLRPVTEADRDTIFAIESDAEGANMIAFLPRDPGDRAAFDAHWEKIRADPEVRHWLALEGETVVGYYLSFLTGSDRDIGYWLVREYWGRGYGTAGLALLLEELLERPLFGRVISDNLGSRRVLEKNGFVVVEQLRTTAVRREGEVTELVLRLD